MRILYIGPYRDSSDDAFDCENRIRLLATEHDVVARSVRAIDEPPRMVHPVVGAAELGTLEKFDLVIQEAGNEAVYFSNPEFKTLYVNEENSLPEITLLFAEDYAKPPQPLKVPQTEGTLRVISIVDGVSGDLYEGVKRFYNSFRPYEKATHTIFTKNSEGIDELCSKARQETNSSNRPPEVIIPIPAERIILPEAVWYGHVENVIEGRSFRQLARTLLGPPEDGDKLPYHNFDIVKVDVEKSKRIHMRAKELKERIFTESLAKFVKMIEEMN